MSFRSTRLAVGEVTTSGDHYVYTAPAASVVLLKSIAIKNAGGGSAQYGFGGYVPPSGPHVDFVVRAAASPLASGASDSWAGWWVLVAGDELDLWTPSAYSLNYWLSGTVLLP